MKAQNSQFSEGDAPEWFTRGLTHEEMDEMAQDAEAKKIKQESADAAMKGAKKPDIADFVPKDKPPF